MTSPTRRTALVALVATATAATTASATTASATAADRARSAVPPLRRAHAHNDYLHQRPLRDALSHGFTSLEADVFLVDGELLVAHEPDQLDPARTLRSLYLDPLAARVRANGGSVYRGHHRPVQLLIDIKSDGVAAYHELHRQLAAHRGILSVYAHGRVRPGAVTPVVSGDRAARVPMAAQDLRYAFYDSRFEDLGTTTAPFAPLISGNWTQNFTWQGIGAFPAAERQRLRTLVSTAHRAGQRIRFWATPDLPGPAREAVWTELLAAGVDHLNTDDLAGLAAFLRRHDA
ncbi:phosphatidylinositol-specific phospholipase C/glycerophosphodiester phosphodiesterase family protein [Streptomyces sp. SP18CS02]|uniref:phosphatidylinositol-specific phospholipase C/glycerophosphodiester phosphodiesterase family protein n=1 Tax=Streptomyces sp. SP18CS02 TaxID=3002531 RepID=UPI002E76FC76|nr:phosphatidylinositol-specific phospholipase C/glycerophosphodiester phosphodiesterase family protein [Streptomyces sp. SP18CS02]MEE1752084.1 phosphatidylinositol-specific phospholipase C/glycerophosphodiester phosphodiesterase family protein [Streptomyces sp. SP18CS02]